jgi:hypothetical protein
MYTTLHTVMFEVKHHAFTTWGTHQLRSSVSGVCHRQMKSPAVGREGAREAKVNELDVDVLWSSKQ